MVTVTRGFLSYKGEIGNIYPGVYVYRYINISIYIYANIYNISWLHAGQSVGKEKKETTTIQVDVFSFLGLVKVEDGSFIPSREQVHIPHLKGKGKTSTQELPLKGAMLC